MHHVNHVTPPAHSGATRYAEYTTIALRGHRLHTPLSRTPQRPGTRKGEKVSGSGTWKSSWKMWKYHLRGIADSASPATGTLGAARARTARWWRGTGETLPCCLPYHLAWSRRGVHRGFAGVARRGARTFLGRMGAGARARVWVVAEVWRSRLGVSRTAGRTSSFLAWRPHAAGNDVGPLASSRRLVRT